MPNRLTQATLFGAYTVCPVFVQAPGPVKLSVLLRVPAEKRDRRRPMCCHNSYCILRSILPKTTHKHVVPCSSTNTVFLRSTILLNGQVPCAALPLTPRIHLPIVCCVSPSNVRPANWYSSFFRSQYFSKPKDLWVFVNRRRKQITPATEFVVSH